jgi:DNA-binding CsgD family transcriptional regulator
MPDALDGFDAARLFLARAAQARPAGGAPPPAAVAQICRRLDGIPLALELAAARTASLPIDRIVADLDDRFRLLSHGSRVAVARHRTLLASVEWSHQLLEPVEQVLLRRLGVFAGGFPIEAAEIVGGFPPLAPADVMDVLAALVDKSLVQLDDSGRYRLLETIREYAAARLCDAAESLTAADQHLGWLADLAERLEPDVDRADGAALDLLETELPNLRAALDHAATGAGLDHAGLRLAGALAHFWVHRNYYALGADVTDRMLAAHPDAPLALRAWARLAGANARMFGADYPGTATETAQALADAGTAGDQRVQARCLVLLGTLQAAGDPVAGLETCTAGLALAQAVQDRWAECQMVGLIGYCHAVRHHPLEAERLEDRNRILATDLDDRGELAWWTVGVGLREVARGQLDAARMTYRRAVVMARQIGDAVIELFGCAGLANVELAAGRASELTEILAGTDHPGWLPYGPAPPVFRILREAAALDTDPESAATALVEGGPAIMPFLPNDGVRLALTGAMVLHRLGDDVRAREVAGAVLAHSVGLSSAFAGTCRVLLARIERRAGAVSAGEQLAHEGLAEMMEAGLLLDVPDALEVLGGLAVDAGSAAEGTRLLAAAAAANAGMGRRSPCADGAEEDRTRAAVALGEEFERVWREGSALDVVAAVAYARRARGERKRPAFGWGGLTPMEREVVRLAAQGLSNPAIAAKLFISRSTVKTHLVHVFAKLGVVSRAELAALAVRRGQA